MSESQLLELVSSRRSAVSLVEPGPSSDQLAKILGAAGSVPDHGLLRPFRFVVAEGEGRLRFGDALARAATEYTPALPEPKLDKIRSKALRSPTLLALIFSPKPGKIEGWEQSATAACAGYAVLLAAQAVGLGAVWKSVPFTRAHALSALLGLTEQEEMLGWIHLGTVPSLAQAPPPRPALALDQVVSVLAKDGRTAYAVR